MKQRVVLFPTPGAGHLVSMIEFAKRIVHHGPAISVTILLIHPASPSAATASHIDALTSSGLDITFICPFPERPQLNGLPHVVGFVESHKQCVSDTLAALAPVSAFVVDMFCIMVADEASRLRIPTFVYFASSTVALATMLYIPTLERRNDSSLQDGEEEGIGLQIPGMMSPVPTSALPSPFQDKNDPMRSWLMSSAFVYPHLAGVVVNSFRELEPRASKALADGLCMPGYRTPPLYSVGPLIGLETGFNRTDGDRDCIDWLDLQPHGSVLYLCFGSLATFSIDQVREVARGLELSGTRFLWSVRAGSAEGVLDTTTLLPPGFLQRVGQRGLVRGSWVPQIAILAHPAVGGFVSHCGWNSVLETVWFGVPLIAWPLFAEQATNAFELVDDLGLGLGGLGSRNGLVKGEELARAVRRLMDGEEGKEARAKMQEMKGRARRAVEEGGSSCQNLTLLVNRWLNPVTQEN